MVLVGSQRRPSELDLFLTLELAWESELLHQLQNSLSPDRYLRMVSRINGLISMPILIWRIHLSTHTVRYASETRLVIVVEQEDSSQKIQEM